MKLKFSIGDSVNIKPLRYDTAECAGRVHAIFISKRGAEYLVRYFHGHKAEEIYFFEDELEAAK